ncbi:tetratricopeptide repeat protein [Saccharothrix luteola]|uniref:tetratricopeptide repeat protein n=1 Tax=Saccharothrix luteola TaxID=2893018 RepID=UPI001E39EE6A|nr:tetratricopeptide repeat protein [Saccharothrix luteola]MCC8249518.1 tetratricopeptide repeat protein [Saccharothrix luteola]
MIGDVNFFHERRVASGVPRQLPVPPRWLVGRARELREFDDALARARANQEMVVLAVEGAAGTGKTALALRWAHDHVDDEFPDGQLFADLGAPSAPRTDASTLSVLHGFLVALGVDPGLAGGDVDTAASLYRSATAGRRMVVVLDNVVHAEQIRPLMPGSASCAVIVTSRTRLSALRMTGTAACTLGMLGRTDARSLLSHHLGEAAVNSDPAAVDVFLDCCDGLPLALAIVAARAAAHPDFPLRSLADELDDIPARLDALETEDGGTGLRAVLSWSYAALADDEAHAFRMASSAPVTELTSQSFASLTAVPPRRAGKLLRRLEARNLLWQRAPDRFGMHALVRLLGRELGSAEDTPDERFEAVRRLVDFYTRTAHGADALLYPHRAVLEPPSPVPGSAPLTLPDEAAALRWFTAEHQQLLALQEHAERQGWLEHVFHLSRSLDTFHLRHARLSDNLRTSRAGAAAADRMGGARPRVLAHRQLGRALTRSDHLEDALRSLARALAVAAELGDPSESAHTHHDIARVHSRLADHSQALHHASRAYALYESVANPIGQAHAANACARCHAELGELDLAERWCESALELHVRHGNSGGQAVALDNLGFIAERAGRPDDAVRAYQHALVLCEEVGHSFYAPVVAEHLGAALAAQGVDGALDALRRAHELYAAQHRSAEAERVRSLVSSLTR